MWSAHVVVDTANEGYLCKQAVHVMAQLVFVHRLVECAGFVRRSGPDRLHRQVQDHFLVQLMGMVRQFFGVARTR